MADTKERPKTAGWKRLLVDVERFCGDAWARDTMENALAYAYAVGAADISRTRGAAHLRALKEQRAASERRRKSERLHIEFELRRRALMVEYEVGQALVDAADWVAATYGDVTPAADAGGRGRDG